MFVIVLYICRSWQGTLFILLQRSRMWVKFKSSHVDRAHDKQWYNNKTIILKTNENKLHLF